MVYQHGTLMDKLDQLYEQKQLLIKLLQLNLKMHIGTDQNREKLINEFLDQINQINQQIEEEKKVRGL